MSKSCGPSLKYLTRTWALTTASTTTLSQVSVISCLHYCHIILTSSLLPSQAPFSLFSTKPPVTLSKLNQIIILLYLKPSNLLLEDDSSSQAKIPTAYKILPNVAPIFFWPHSWLPPASTQSLSSRCTGCSNVPCTETHFYLCTIRPAVPFVWNALPQHICKPHSSSHSGDSVRVSLVTWIQNINLSQHILSPVSSKMCCCNIYHYLANIQFTYFPWFWSGLSTAIIPLPKI